MITCVYCCHECPDDAQICPNCGKPIFRISVDDTPDYNKLAEALRRDNDINQAELSQKQVIHIACIVLLLALVVYSIFTR